MEKKTGFKDSNQQVACADAAKAQEKKKWQKPNRSLKTYRAK
jgi:hypothetical protein